MNRYMNMAMALAKMVEGQTGKNPPVGAVIVKDGRVIGLGAHLKAGEAHAEVQALESCIESPDNAEMYVSLEPCNHHGKTPPCVDRLIEAGIKHVYYGFKDYSLNGKSSEKLRENGIQSTHLKHPEAEELYRPFLITKGASRPFITLKCAMSIDGKIALRNGESYWVSNDISREDTHHLRHSHDAIMVGGSTLLNDDPSLTTRLTETYSHAVPVVLLGSKKLAPDMNIFQHPLKPIIFTNNKENLKFDDKCCIYYGTFTMEEIFAKLYDKNISS